MFTEQLADYYQKQEVNHFFNLLSQHILNFSPVQQLVQQYTRITESQINKYLSAIKALKTHKPIQYIIGYEYFKDLKINVNEHVLIPRPETEELVNWVIDSVNNTSSINLVDLCTGSGCIAIALKKHLPAPCSVNAVDISKQALEIAKLNAIENKVDVNFHCIDVLNEINIFKSESMDIIVSNPPYVLQSDKALMNKNVLNYEPHLALFVNDDDPLVFYNKIADVATKILKPNGQLFFEIHENYANEIVQLLKNLQFINIEVRLDIHGKKRMIKAQKL